MEFSHLEQDTVYIKGTGEDKNNILTLINNFKDNDEVLVYTGYSAARIAEVKISTSGDTFVISLLDLNVIFSVLAAMWSMDYDSDPIGISEEHFKALKDTIYEIVQKSISA